MLVTAVLELWLADTSSHFSFVADGTTYSNYVNIGNYQDHSVSKLLTLIGFPHIQTNKIPRLFHDVKKIVPDQDNHILQMHPTNANTTFFASHLIAAPPELSIQNKHLEHNCSTC